MEYEELERLEHTAFSMVVQALTDYRESALTIFKEEVDQPQDIAEDVTREAIAAMGLPGMPVRLYGKVDVKRAIYVFLPRAYPVALMVDAKAEKDDKRTATIQMSQTSMEVRMVQRNEIVREPGKLSQEITRADRVFHVVSVVAKFVYSEKDGERSLDKLIAACIPNGKLQEFYNPTHDDTIWLAGRHAPTRGEDFRVRLSFKRLWKKAMWRVHDVI